VVIQLLPREEAGLVAIITALEVFGALVDYVITVFRVRQYGLALGFILVSALAALKLVLLQLISEKLVQLGRLFEVSFTARAVRLPLLLPLLYALSTEPFLALKAFHWFKDNI